MLLAKKHWVIYATCENSIININLHFLSDLNNYNFINDKEYN